MRILLLLFIVLPIAELYVLLAVGRQIGFWETLAITLIVGALGAALAKREGLRVLRRYQEALGQGRMPEEGVLGGLLLFAGGILMLTPGLITDVIGLLLLFPPTRRVAVALMRRWLARRIRSGQMHVFQAGRGPFGAGPGDEHERPDVIDVDVVEKEPPPRP